MTLDRSEEWIDCTIECGGGSSLNVSEIDSETSLQDILKATKGGRSSLRKIFRSSRSLRWLSPRNTLQSVPTDTSEDDMEEIMCLMNNRRTRRRGSPQPVFRSNRLASRNPEIHITFTPSEDLEDCRNDFSPVARAPEASVPTFVTKRNRQADDGGSVWNQILNLLVILLTLSCISGHASDQLIRWNVPDKVFHWVQHAISHEPAGFITMKPAVPMKLFVWDESEKPESKFLNTKHNPMGVWLS